MTDSIELGNGWRVAIGETQWTLEQWRSPRWRPRSYCCTRSALARCIGEHCGGEVDLTRLLALPEWHPDREASKALNSLQTTSDAVLPPRKSYLGSSGCNSWAGCPHELALLAPRGIALNELNLHREVPLTDADLVRALRDQRVDDYPQRASRHRRASRPTSSRNRCLTAASAATQTAARRGTSG